MSVFDDLAADAMASAPAPHTAATRRAPVLLELHPSPHKAAAAVIERMGRDYVERLIVELDTQVRR